MQEPHDQVHHQQQQQQSTIRPSALDSAAGFGGRTLEDAGRVFDHNAWDNVPWVEEQEARALEVVSRQMQDPVSDADRLRYHAEAAAFWDKFYSAHSNSFFKDRHWLRQEFPELFDALQAPALPVSTVPSSPREPFSNTAPPTVGPAERKRIFEIGCGAGNTAFPLVEEDPNVFVYAADFSSTAIKVVKESPLYSPDRIQAFVYDITSPEFPSALNPSVIGTIDICVCIFVLSALKPSDWKQAAKNIFNLLRPGGIVVFRDYGRYDLAQLRFKKERYLGENFYVRGDGTQVYFFSQEDVNKFFADFEVLQNVVDRRLLVNRSRQLKMYRVWIQAKYRKPSAARCT
ncbi:S-adenosyl-L-methionine-dependent methyltransferase [Zopfochytrium polystomum]|nr:S-adenosyl-L-methionine-dependent methyltransferase [Zopfochytrium polystomum]